MNKIILILVGLFSAYINAFGQVSNEKIAFVVDSIQVINDPEEGNEILAPDIGDISIVKIRTR